MPSIQLFIPEPCHENWDAMTPTDQGRYCQSCAKEVIDFGCMSDAEIIAFLDKKQGSICGNFMNTQLERPITAVRRKSLSFRYFFQFFIPAFMFAQKARAQGKIVYAGVKIENHAEQSVSGNFTAGVIRDAKTRLPLTGVTVKIKGRSIGIQTDSAGMFRIQTTQLFKSVVAQVSCIGYQPYEQVLYAGKENQEILLQPAEVKLDTVVIVANSSYTRGSMRTAGAMFSVTSCTYKRPVLKQVVDTIMNRNQVKAYPNPVSRNETVHINMKKVEPGEYLIRLFNGSGVLVQEDNITVPQKDFIYQFAFRKVIAAGTYTLNVISPAKHNVYTSKIVVL